MSNFAPAKRSKAFQAFTKLSAVERRAVIDLPGTLPYLCFPEGIEMEDFDPNKKVQADEAEGTRVAHEKKKKTRHRAVPSQAEASRMGRG